MLTRQVIEATLMRAVCLIPPRSIWQKASAMHSKLDPYDFLILVTPHQVNSEGFKSYCPSILLFLCITLPFICKTWTYFPLALTVLTIRHFSLKKLKFQFITLATLDDA